MTRTAHRRTGGTTERHRGAAAALPTRGASLAGFGSAVPPFRRSAVFSPFRRSAVSALALVTLVAVSAAPPFRRSAEAQEPPGKAVYDRWCAGCHGEDGAGRGEAAAFMLPPPRDFTRAAYQIRSTPSGELPTDADLRRIVDDGMPGTAMPGWRTRLSASERDAVVAYIKSFSRFFDGASAEALASGSAPRASAEGIEEGARIYRELECFKCHGDAGRGDGASAPTLTDDWGHPIRAANLTQGWTFNGGGETEHIFTRLRTGLDGTPMPSFSDVIDAEVITEEQLWRLAQYVRSLTPDRPPVREVIRAVRVESALPSGPDDAAWQTIEPAFVPLVGQIVIRPRWFAPRVEGLWVRAAHDGTSLALLVTWSDPSASPDPAWQEWADRMAATMSAADGAVAAAQGPDRLHVQFPLRRESGMERPYFLGGDTRRPAYQWRWTSAPDAVAEGRATGLGAFAAAERPAVTHAASFADGERRVQFTRSLAPADTATAPAFSVGEAIPIAFLAADGSNGEDAVRAAVSTWYAVYLDVPTPAGVYVIPVVAALLTAGLGGLAVVRAQRRAARP
jgi:mono/diheme cytochrome c family protein